MVENRPHRRAVGVALDAPVAAHGVHHPEASTASHQALRRSEGRRAITYLEVDLASVHLEADREVGACMAHDVGGQFRRGQDDLIDVCALRDSLTHEPPHGSSCGGLGRELLLLKHAQW